MEFQQIYQIQQLGSFQETIAAWFLSYQSHRLTGLFVLGKEKMRCLQEIF